MTLVQDIISALQKPMPIVRDDGRNGHLVPPGWDARFDRNEIAAIPPYMEKKIVFETMDDYIRYLQDHAGDGSIVWATTGETNFFRAVIDSHQPDTPSFERHLADLPLTRSVEWLAWSKISGQWLTGPEFSEFLEDNIEFIVGDFSGAKVLSMCRDLSVKTDSDTAFTTDVLEGRRTLKMSGSTTITGGNVVFPEFLSARLRVFKHYDPVEFEVRLRVNGGDNGVLFQIKLADKELVEEQAFEHIATKLETDMHTASLIDTPVYRGWVSS